MAIELDKCKVVQKGESLYILIPKNYTNLKKGDVVRIRAEKCNTLP